MNEDTVKVVIKPVSNWTSLAVQYKRNGGASVTAFLLYMMLSCIKVPAREIPRIREAWREEGNN